MKVIVCGGRAYDGFDHVFKILDHFHQHLGFTSIIEGGAQSLDIERKILLGADFYARMWARSRSVPFETIRADWKKHGRAAGPIRNQFMLDKLEAGDVVIAFPGGRGTRDMIRRASKAGYPVLRSLPDEVVTNT
jgi:hypothetical protein